MSETAGAGAAAGVSRAAAGRGTAEHDAADRDAHSGGESGRRGIPAPGRFPLGRVRPVQPPSELPVWPVVLLLAGFPVFWVLGLASFAPVLCAVPMVALLWARRDVVLPLGFAYWGFFLLWVGVAALALDNAMRLVGYGMRLGNFLGATVTFVYVYNLNTRRFGDRRALTVLLAFFAFVVLGGWLGVLLPDVRLHTPMSLLLPGSIASNEYVGALVRPRFAEVQHPWGAPQPFTRPSAPFAYTNSWGCNVALLVPCMLALVALAGRRVRLLTVTLLLLALVPAFATLNRGLYIAVVLGLVYAVARFAFHGRVVPLVGLGVAGVVIVVAADAVGLLGGLSQRLEYSATNVSRATIYAEAFEGTLRSPLIGNGAPRPSATLEISVGTQGQIWNIMFSFGFVGLFLFLGWFTWLAVVSRRWRRSSDLWLHVCLVVSLVTMVYYGYDGMQLVVVMLVAALVLRRLRPPVGQRNALGVAR
ncbi:hypothetical protein KIH74_16495 [Kineosporia sp. J2-2]|uniref:O-antigen ligase n=1 Tax=Kineosporia corallincola TaxID=2835133 RepID=A0ABS5THM2_9ACTN|nr:hypothetical protein [Kineosporia corallincola]MBT0770545.1 hypothetical protein [Kineosporia corallincola]